MSCTSTAVHDHIAERAAASATIMLYPIPPPCRKIPETEQEICHGLPVMPEYLPRLVDPLLDELLADHPAVLVVGPRACGKTTTGRRHCRERLRLDRPAEATVVRADPDAALGRSPLPPMPGPPSPRPR
jgi:hypothetical protein